MAIDISKTVKLIDSATGGLISFAPIITLPNGNTPTDSVVDNVLFTKKGGVYYQRIITNNTIYIDWFGDYVGNTEADCGLLINNILATLTLAYPSQEFGNLIIQFGSGIYQVKTMVTLSQQGIYIQGMNKRKTALVLSEGAYFNLDSITNLTLSDFAILTGDNLSLYALKLNYCRESRFENIQISGYFITCAIYNGDNNWSNKFNDLVIANITNGDGIYLQGHDTNSVQFNRCFITNIEIGCGVRVRGTNGVVFNKPQMEQNNNGCFVIEPGLYTKALTINDLYHENGGPAFAKPFMWIDNPSNLPMSVRGVRINNGFAFMGDQIFLDLSGFPSVSGSRFTGLEVLGIQISVVANGAIKMNNSGVIRGIIDVPPPYAGDLGEQPLLTPDTDLTYNRLQIRKKTMGGDYGYTVPFSIGKKNPNITSYTEGTFYYDGDSDMVLQGATGSYSMRNAPYLISQTAATLTLVENREYIILADATAAPITINLAANTLYSNRASTIKVIKTTTVNSVTIKNSAGTTVAVLNSPQDEVDIIVGNQILPRIIYWRLSGTTAQRPTVVFISMQYFDTTLGKPIYVKTTSPLVWVDAAGTTV